MSENYYYWLKLKRDFFKRHDIRIVENMPNGKDYILFYLKLLCESVDHEGNLRFSEEIPYNEEMLATITDTNVDIVRAAIGIFSNLGMIDIMDNGTYYMNEVTKMIGKAADNDNARRQQRFRDKQKALALPISVTKNNASVTECVTNNNENKSIDIDIDKDIIKENNKKKSEVYFWGDEKLNQTFLDYIDMRKKIKKPMTERAISLAMNKLSALSNGNHDIAIKILEQSIMNSWQGLFELKEPGRKPNKLESQYQNIVNWAEGE